MGSLTADAGGTGSSGAEGIFGCLLMSLLRRYVPVPFGLSGAESLASARLSSSLVRPPVFNLGSVGSSGATWPSPTCAANCTDASASVYPMPTGYTGAPASDHPMPLTLAELVHFKNFFEFFLRV